MPLFWLRLSILYQAPHPTAEHWHPHAVLLFYVGVNGQGTSVAWPGTGETQDMNDVSCWYEWNDV